MTTLVWRDGVLAADSAVTIYDGNDDDAQPSAREYMQKITIHDLDAYWRLAVATRGDSVDGVLIERGIVNRLRSYADDQGHDWLSRPGFDCWCPDIDKTDLDKPDDEQGGILACVDLRRLDKVYAWQFGDYRVIRRLRPGEWVAVGSDAAIAHGALQAGADAIKSVWAACRFGAYSGGPVHYVKTSSMILNTSRIAPWDDPGKTRPAPEAVLGADDRH